MVKCELRHTRVTAAALLFRAQPPMREMSVSRTVDPDTGDALAFVMPQHKIAKAKLEPSQATTAEIEQAAGVHLPLPQDSRRGNWPANITAWNKKHKVACGK